MGITSRPLQPAGADRDQLGRTRFHVATTVVEDESSRRCSPGDEFAKIEAVEVTVTVSTAIEEVLPFGFKKISPPHGGDELDAIEHLINNFSRPRSHAGGVPLPSSATGSICSRSTMRFVAIESMASMMVFQANSSRGTESVAEKEQSPAEVRLEGPVGGGRSRAPRSPSEDPVKSSSFAFIVKLHVDLQSGRETLGTKHSFDIGPDTDNSPGMRVSEHEAPSRPT